MSERPFKPGEIEIEKFVITNYTRSKVNSTSLTQICNEFSYYESIFAPTIAADFLITDAVGMLNDLPVIGDEDIELSFRDKLNSNVIDVNLRSYKIGSRVRSSERSVIYPIMCASERGVLDSKTQVESISKGRISDYINRTFKGFIEVEPTQGEYRYVPTGETFFETMKILSREAQSQNNPSSTYLFYETSDGYHFVTLEFLFTKPTIKEYFYNLSNASRRSDRFSDDQVISKLEFTNGNNLIENMRKGLYGNSTYAIDPLRKSISQRTYDYFGDGFLKTKHLPNVPSRIQSNIKGITGGSSFAQNSQSANEKYFISDLNDVANIEYIKEYDPETNIYGRRRHLFSNLETSLFAQSTAFKTTISIPGDSSRHAGDVIEIYMPEISQQESVLYQYDKYLSGRFLVTSVRHLLQVNGEYVTVMECIKDSLEEYLRSTLGDLPEQYFD